MLAIAGGKGGSGKTTTALGVATVMARKGLNPVVVDCDCDMPDLHHLLGIDRNDGVDAVAAGMSIERACLSSSIAPGVRCLTAGDRSSVDAALSRVADWHDPVILDCPPGAGPDAIRPLRHARRAVIISTNQPDSIADAQTTTQTARELGTPLVGLILRRTGDHGDVEWLDESPILARTTSVETPLEHPQIRADWARATQQIRSFRRSPHTERSPRTNRQQTQR